MNILKGYKVICRAKRLLRPLAYFTLFLLVSTNLRADELVLVVGVGGEEAYAKQFEQWAQSWQSVAQESQFKLHRIGPGAEKTPHAVPESSGNEGSLNDKQHLQQLLSDLATADTAPLWVVMIGHGTFQQGLANFNLRGPDISADEFAESLKPAERPLVLIHAFSSSGPWLAKLSGKDRIIITATRGGDEQNFSRFGQFLASAISDTTADLDHDLNVSLLEAFIKASSDTARFYENEGRLQTEHPLIDDNGDALGTPPTFFRGVRIVQQATNNKAPDGQRALTTLTRRSEWTQQFSAEQKQQISILETQINELRQKKETLEEDDYFAQLEPLLVELARVELGDSGELGEPAEAEDGAEPGGAATPPKSPKSSAAPDDDSADADSPQPPASIDEADKTDQSR